MKMQLFSIKDTALQAYMQPFFAHTRAAAVRAFTDGINDNSTPMNKHPEDYELYHVGEYDDQLGLVTGIPIELIARAKDLAMSKQ